MAAHLVLDGHDRMLVDDLVIDGAAGHHLQRARRLTPGEDVTVADGLGTWRRYRVTAVGKGSLELAASAEVRVEPVPAYELIAAPALISRNRFDTVVAQLTELGVDAIVPLVTERCVARWDRGDVDSVTTRLRAVAREASMQCRRSRVPRIDAPCTPTQIASLNARIVVAARDGARAIDATHSARVVIVSGPEGGLSTRDLSELGAHECLCLGRFVQRAETAPLAAIALLAQQRDASGAC